MTLLFIRKANIPPTRVNPAANQAGNASPAPAAKTQPAKPPGRPKTSSGIVYEYYDGEGQPPAGGGWESYTKQDGSMGNRRPAGSGGGAQPQAEEDDGEEVTDEEVSEVEPPSPPNATPHDPQDATDPLKNDDGSAHGTEPLDADPFGIKEVLAGENAQPEGTKTLAPDKFATQADTRQTQILQNISQQTGETPSIKEVRSIPLAERDSAGVGGTSKPVSKKKDGAGIPSAKDDASNHKEARRGKEFKLPEKKKKNSDSAKTAVTKPIPKDGGVDPYATTEVGSFADMGTPIGAKRGDVPKTVIPDDEPADKPEAKTEVKAPKTQSGSAKTQVDSTDTKADKVKARREKADSSRKKSTTKDIKETKKRAQLHEKAKERYERNKASSEEKLNKVKEERVEAKKASSGHDKDIKAIGKDLDKTRKDLASAEKGSFEHKQASKKLDDLNGKLMVANAKAVGHKRALSDLDEKEAKIKQGLKDSEKDVSDTKAAHDELKDHHGKDLPESPVELLNHKEHTDKAKKQLDVIDAHIDEDPDNEDLWNLREVFAEQADISHNPGPDDKAALNRGSSYASDNGFTNDDVSSPKTRKREPKTPAEKIAHKEHTEKAQKQLDIINSHLAEDPDNEDLNMLRESLTEQSKISHIPRTSDRSALARGMAYSKHKGASKHMDDINADKEAATKKEAEKQAKTEATAKKQEETAQKKQAALEEKAKKKAEADALKQRKKDNPDEKRSKASSGRSSNAMSSYNSGGSVGSRIGALGTKGGATQAISLAADVPKGAVSAGHHLLTRKKEEKKEEKPEVDPKDDPLKKDDPDQKKAVTKSMKLYIKKAIGQTPNASINSSDKSPEENEEDHESSYKKRTVGVMGGDASEDTKGSGRKMNEPHKSVKKGEK